MMIKDKDPADQQFNLQLQILVITHNTRLEKKLYSSVINGFEICGERDIMERDKNKIKKKKKNIQIELEK